MIRSSLSTRWSNSRLAAHGTYSMTAVLLNGIGPVAARRAARASATSWAIPRVT